MMADSSTVADGLWLLAANFERRGAVAQAIKCLEALCQSPLPFLPAVEVKTRLWLSTALLHHSANLKEATQHLERAQVLLKSLRGDSSIKCSVIGQLARCYWLGGQANMQRHMLQRGLEYVASKLRVESVPAARAGLLSWGARFCLFLAAAQWNERDVGSAIAAVMRGREMAAEAADGKLQLLLSASLLHLRIASPSPPSSSSSSFLSFSMPPSSSSSPSPADPSLVATSIAEFKSLWQAAADMQQHLPGLHAYGESLQAMWHLRTCNFQEAAKNVENLRMILKTTEEAADETDATEGGKGVRGGGFIGSSSADASGCRSNSSSSSSSLASSSSILRSSAAAPSSLLATSSQSPSPLSSPPISSPSLPSPSISSSRQLSSPLLPPPPGLLSPSAAAAGVGLLRLPDFLVAVAATGGDSSSVITTHQTSANVAHTLQSGADLHNAMPPPPPRPSSTIGAVAATPPPFSSLSASSSSMHLSTTSFSPPLACPPQPFTSPHAPHRPSNLLPPLPTAVLPKSPFERGKTRSMQELLSSVHLPPSPHSNQPLPRQHLISNASAPLSLSAPPASPSPPGPSSSSPLSAPPPPLLHPPPLLSPQPLLPHHSHVAMPLTASFPSASLCPQPSKLQQQQQQQPLQKRQLKDEANPEDQKRRKTSGGYTLGGAVGSSRLALASGGMQAEMRRADWMLDSDWLPRSAIAALLEGMAAAVGRREGRGEDLNRRLIGVRRARERLEEELLLLSVSPTTRESDRLHPWSIWVVALLLSLLLHLLLTEALLCIIASEFLQAQKVQLAALDWSSRFPTIILPPPPSSVLCIAGHYCHAMGCFLEATSHFLKAAESPSASKPSKSVLLASAALATLHSNDPEAMSKAIQILSLAKQQLASPADMVHLSNPIGSPPAQPLMREETRAEVAILFVEGLLRAKQGNLTEARSALSRGMKLTEKVLGSYQVASQFCIALGAIFAATDDVSGAKKILSSGKKLARAVRDFPSVLSTVVHLKDLHVKLGEKELELEAANYEKRKRKEVEQKRTEAREASGHETILRLHF